MVAEISAAEPPVLEMGRILKSMLSALRVNLINNICKVIFRKYIGFIIRKHDLLLMYSRW